MSFDVATEAYGAYMGRWSEPLAEPFLAQVGVRVGERVLDVGCGPGVVTSRLVDRVGRAAVAAVEPSEPFAAAAHHRFGLQVVRARAEALPYADAVFDVTLAQLVVHFMTDPDRGIGEMARVTRPGGRVAACVWDHGGDGGPLALFWRTVRELDHAAHDESDLAGAREGDLTRRMATAGLVDVEARTLTVSVGFADVDDWWRPFTLGVGPGGAYVAGLDERARDALRRRCAALLPDGPFELTATAWSAVGTVPAA